MKIMELDIKTLERLKEYTKPSHTDDRLDYSTMETLRESVERFAPKILELVVLQSRDSICLVVVKNGNYYHYDSGTEVRFDITHVSRMCLIAEYTKKDIDMRTFLPLPTIDSCESANEYVNRLID